MPVAVICLDKVEYAPYMGQNENCAAILNAARSLS
jgi:hypothetical protein